MIRELRIGEDYAAHVAPVENGCQLTSLHHLPTGVRLLDHPVDLIEIARAGHWVGSRALTAQVLAGAVSAGEEGRRGPAQFVFEDAFEAGTLTLTLGTTAEGALVITLRTDGVRGPVRLRLPLIAAVAARAVPDSRAALTLHDASFRWEQLAAGRADGALFLPGHPRIPLWRTNFLPMGTLLHLRPAPNGPGTCLWLNRRDETLAEAFAAVDAVDAAGEEGFPLGGTTARAETLELTISGAPGGWRGWLADQRRRLLARLDLSVYERPDLRWLRHCVVAGYLFCYEHDFYDERRGGYRYRDWLARAEEELGGFDLIMLCQGSPRLGIDARNQHDLHRDVPGGLEALRDFVAAAHRHGSRVVYDYRPWDTCTRQSDYPADHLAGFVELLRETDLDGAFNDTGDSVPPGFREAADRIRPGIAFTSEFSPATEADLETHVSSWAQQPGDRNEPALFIDVLKFLLPVHQVHLASRWSRYHPRLLTQALFNGQGFYIWESHYGSWTVWGSGSRAMAKRCGAILRANGDAFSSLDWEPLVPAIAPGVYANRWPAGDKQLFTLVAVSDVPVGTPLLAIPHAPGARYVDLWNRREVEPEMEGSTAQLAAPIAVDLPACLGVFRRRIAIGVGADALSVDLVAPDAEGGCSWSPVAALRASLVADGEERTLAVEQTATARWRIPLPADSDLPRAGVMVEAVDGGLSTKRSCQRRGAAAGVADHHLRAQAAAGSPVTARQVANRVCSNWW